MGDGINWNEWLAVKKSPFNVDKSGQKCKLLFNIAWNDVELKFAITCQKGHRVARDEECEGWATLLSIQQLIYVHQQLCLINEKLNCFLSDLPNSPRKLWSYTSASSFVVSPQLCSSLECYFKSAVEMCGQDIVMELLFEQAADDDRYFEDVNELEREHYHKQVVEAEKELVEVLQMRNDAENMLQMVSIYSLEDQVVNKVNRALAWWFSYQLQPFLDLRELAFSKLRSARAAIDSEDLGPRVKEQRSREYIEWQTEYMGAIDNIRSLYINYYKKSTAILKAQKERAEMDRECFGRATFETLGSSRLDLLEIAWREEKLKWLRAKRLTKEHEKDKAQHELISVKSTSDVMKVESDVYNHQIGDFDLRLEIFKEEELLIRKKIAVLMKNRKDASEVDVFFDTVETEKDINEIEDDESMTNSTNDDPEMASLKQKLANVSCRRAKLRIRRNKCIATREKQLEERSLPTSRVKIHHAIQSKRDEKKKKEEEDKERVEKERKNTLLRLRNYRMRYPAARALRNRVQLRETEQPRDENKNDKQQSQLITIAINDDPPTSLHVSPCCPPIAPPPPPPPPPPGLPPPPPPPPLPVTFNLCANKSRLDLSSSLKSGTAQRGAQVEPTCSVISLSSVLEARSKLRKRRMSVDVSTDDKLDEVLNVRSRLSDTSPGGGDMTKVLREAMQRIRPLVADSDPDSTDTDDDFD